jgi:hypothetical protein
VSAAAAPALLKNKSFKNSGLTLLGAWHGSCFVSSGETTPRVRPTFQETIMDTRISSKLGALALALMMNGFIIGGVAYLFDAQNQQHSSVISFAKQLATFQWLI